MSFGAIIRNDFTPAPRVDLKFGYRKHDWQVFDRNERVVPLLTVSFPIFSNVFVRKRRQTMVTNQLLVSFVTGKTAKLHHFIRVSLNSTSPNTTPSTGKLMKLRQFSPIYTFQRDAALVRCFKHSHLLANASHFRGKIRVSHPLGAQKPLARVRKSKKTQTLVEIFAAL